MRRTEASVELVDTVDVPKSRVGGIDPVNDAVRIAKRERDTATSPDAVRYDYEAVDHGGYYRVLVKGYATGRTHGRDVDVEGAAGSVSRGGFEEKNVLEHRSVDVAGELASRLTVADIRELGREHDVSYRRGSRKRELAEQFVEQAPGAAKELV